MNDAHARMMDYVAGLFTERGTDLSANIHQAPFRHRSEHIRRVTAWAQRLCRGRGVDTEAVIVAAIFHDAGSAVMDDKRAGDPHGPIGAGLCEEYLRAHGYDERFVLKVSTLIARHSDKALLACPSTSLELILLMEADLLDETGALALTWDAMAEALQPGCSFASAYHHIREKSVRQHDENPFVTPAARAIYAAKQALVREFTAQLAGDLAP